jgi:hypothetical protein
MQQVVGTNHTHLGLDFILSEQLRQRDLAAATAA